MTKKSTLPSTSIINRFLLTEANILMQCSFQSTVQAHNAPFPLSVPARWRLRGLQSAELALDVSIRCLLGRRDRPPPPSPPAGTALMTLGGGANIISTPPARLQPLSPLRRSTVFLLSVACFSVLCLFYGPSYTSS